MCIRDRAGPAQCIAHLGSAQGVEIMQGRHHDLGAAIGFAAVSYTHLRAHETVLDLVCRLLLEKKKKNTSDERDTLAG